MKFQFENLASAIIFLFIGLALFIVGMNIMSGGLKKATGKKIKGLFKKIQNNPIASLGIGAGTTALIQSSAATSVIVFGFISAGVLTLTQGISIILGAYIGTTVTGLLVSLSSFNISIFLMALAFIGVVLMFFKKELVKNIGEILCGLGLMFVGLEGMKGAFAFEDIKNFCITLFSTINFPLLLLVIGALLTALTQSSSATSGIVIVMVGTGAIPLSSGFYLVLGATVGTLIVTVLASIGGATEVKRASFVCIILRVTTAILATLIIWPFANYIAEFLLNAFKSPELALAMFSVFYGIISVFVVVPFVKPLTKVSEKAVKDKKAEKMKETLKFINNKLLDTPSAALIAAKNEIINMANLSYQNYQFGYNRIRTQDGSNDDEIISIEDKIDYLNNQITSFLIELSSRVDKDDEKIIGGYFHVINDIERIGDHAYNFYEVSKKMVSNDLAFSDNAKAELDQMNEVILKMYAMAIASLNEEEIDLNVLHGLEQQTDDLKTKLSDAHYDRITKNLCKTELSPFYSTLVSELERVADHLTNIGYISVNPTGDEL